MTDPVKEARDFRHVDPAVMGLVNRLADEIERLEAHAQELMTQLKFVEEWNLGMRYGDPHKAVIEDMREWGRESTIYDERTWSDHLDDYAKDRGIE